ncbi:MAG: magnesium transporter CorA family protein [Thermomicrobiales bacterium]|nr:magnesium transporter CorA family protein [Thermomicrobiales bacterium]
MPSVIAIDAKGRVDRTRTLQDIPGLIGQPDRLLWVDFEHPPTADQLARLGELFDLPARTLLHLVKQHRGPRAVRFLKCRLVVIFDVGLDPHDGVQTSELVHLIGENYLITTHPPQSNVIPLAAQAIEVEIATFGYTVSTLTYSILDQLVGRYDTVIGQIQGEVDQLRQRILQHHESEGVDDIYRLNQQLGELRQVMSPEEALIGSMHSPQSASETPDLTDAFQDVSIDLQTTIGSIDQMANLVSGLLDTYESLKSDALNLLVKRLTVLSIMLALVALIPALFGISINDPSWPFRTGYVGYALNVLGMALLGWLVWIVARRIGWIK